MQQQHLLRQLAVAGEVGEPGDDAVHLVGADAPDLPHVALTRPQPPLGVERQTDVRLGQQLLVQLRLGEEVVVARLQVEHDGDARAARRVDERTDVVELGLVGVVAVTERRRRDGGDDLERRHHRHGAAGRLVLGGEALGAGDRLLDALLAQHAERRRAGVAVEGDVELARQDELAAARQLHAGRRRRQARLEPPAVAEGVAERQHRGRRRLGQGRDERTARAGVGRAEQVDLGAGGTGGGHRSQGVGRRRRGEHDEPVLPLDGAGALDVGCGRVEGERGDGGERVATGSRSDLGRLDDLDVVEALRPLGRSADGDDRARVEPLDLGRDGVLGGCGGRLGRCGAEQQGCAGGHGHRGAAGLRGRVAGRCDDDHGRALVQRPRRGGGEPRGAAAEHLHPARPGQLHGRRGGRGSRRRRLRGGVVGCAGGAGRQREDRDQQEGVRP